MLNRFCVSLQVVTLTLFIGAVQDASFHPDQAPHDVGEEFTDDAGEG